MKVEKQPPVYEENRPVEISTLKPTNDEMKATFEDFPAKEKEKD